MYKKIDARIWEDRRFNSLSKLNPSGQALWLFLLTNKFNGPIPGFLPIGFGAIQDILKWSKKDLRAAFKEIFEAGLLENFGEDFGEDFPEDFGEDFGDVIGDDAFSINFFVISNAIKYNKPVSPNVVLSWWKYLKNLPECERCERALLQLHKDVSSLGSYYARAIEESFLRAFGEKYKTSGKPFGKTSGKTSGMSSSKELANIQYTLKDKKNFVPISQNQSLFDQSAETENTTSGKPTKKINGEIINTTKKTDITSKKFTPPTLTEIQNYIHEKNYSIDAETFFSFYEHKNWMIDKYKKMSNWKATVRYWQTRNKKNESVSERPFVI